MNDEQTDRQADIAQLRELLDLMTDFPSNDQRARYLLSSNWMRQRGAAAAARAQAELDGREQRTQAYYRAALTNALKDQQ